MNRLMLPIFLVIASATLGSSHSETSPSILEESEFGYRVAEHLKVFSKDTHPRNPEQRNITQQYIIDKFRYIGLEVETQTFNTSIKMSYNDDQYFIGTNIIATRKGSSPRKNVMVIGAHYDSTGVNENHQPERANGVGIATLLEVAAAYEGSLRWNGFTANYTTIFVAFDLNTKQQMPASPGMPGSYYFVQDWLEPKIKREFLTFDGSFILDSIATYNTEVNSQNLPADFIRVLPEAYQTITSYENKGNFLAAVSSGDKSAAVLKDFSGHYNHDKKARPFRLQMMVGNISETGFGAYETLEMFDKQASFHFWAASRPSVLLTDTADKRLLPKGEQSPVDEMYVFWNPQRLAFVHKTYVALSYTVLDRQTTYTGLAKSHAPSLETTSSLMAMVVVAVIARIFN
ncbi:uncharacterized protein LOC108681607 [Hyalella azteca]|uniref:Uncharacterized protein LOC108681607 n=1 Tax=Hyalella azteca TaxID=294128 RepID=A0A8B7PL75_HYAAZ|nr:uncharacterized protein LOC108681607 [Hyalella azteca]